MQYRVIVSFGKDGQYDYKFSVKDIAGVSGEVARQWFDREFEALGCEVISPTGKILLVDRILSVAKYAGMQRFHDQQIWADQFARYTLALLGRDLVRVDVGAYAIGY